MSIWDGLRGSPGWQALAALYGEDLADLRERLLALALESPDPKVRGVASQIRAIEDVLARPERELERRSEGEDKV